MPIDWHHAVACIICTSIHGGRAQFAKYGARSVSIGSLVLLYIPIMVTRFWHCKITTCHLRYEIQKAHRTPCTSGPTWAARLKSDANGLTCSHFHRNCLCQSTARELLAVRQKIPCHRWPRLRPLLLAFLSINTAFWSHHCPSRCVNFSDLHSNAGTICMNRRSPTAAPCNDTFQRGYSIN